MMARSLFTQELKDLREDMEASRSRGQKYHGGHATSQNTTTYGGQPPNHSVYGGHPTVRYTPIIRMFNGTKRTMYTIPHQTYQTGKY